jgi:hypothetical protein
MNGVVSVSDKWHFGGDWDDQPRLDLLTRA